MSEPYRGWVYHTGYEDFPDSATITRWADSPWWRLVRGQRVSMYNREWRVTEVQTYPDGTETYQLEPAEVVDARTMSNHPATQ